MQVFRFSVCDRIILILLISNTFYFRKRLQVSSANWDFEKKKKNNIICVNHTNNPVLYTARLYDCRRADPCWLKTLGLGCLPKKRYSSPECIAYNGSYRYYWYPSHSIQPCSMTTSCSCRFTWPHSSWSENLVPFALSCSYSHSSSSATG